MTIVPTIDTLAKPVVGVKHNTSFLPEAACCDAHGAETLSLPMHERNSKTPWDSGGGEQLYGWSRKGSVTGTPALFDNVRVHTSP